MSMYHLRRVNSNESQEDLTLEYCEFDIDVNSGKHGRMLAQSIAQLGRPAIPGRMTRGNKVYRREHYVAVKDFDKRK